MTPLDPDDLAATFADVAARHDRCVWLDGGGSRDWSGRRSILGWLEDDDVSLTYDAARREVTRHRGGRREIVGDDVFAVLESELADGPASAQWFGYLGYACRPDLPARPAGSDGVPDAVWVRPSHLRFVDHPAAAGQPRPASSRPSATEVPATYRAAFERIQEHLHAGDTYEVNLTERHRLTAGLDPATAYLALRRLNPAPYAGFLQHRVADATGWLLSSSPERYALVTVGPEGRMLETKPIKGTLPRLGDPAADAVQAERQIGRAHV